MKRRIQISWLLMLVSIIMLTASVLPHHHHEELLCLQHDVVEQTSDCQEDAENDDSGCRACCVTKFDCSRPDSDDALDSYHPLETILFTLTAICLQPLCLEEDAVKNYLTYHEILHSRHLPGAIGLRAPPVTA